MKQNHKLLWPLIGRLFIVCFFFIIASKMGAGDNNSASYTITSEDVLNSANISAASIKEHGTAGAYLIDWDGVSDKWRAERGQLINELIKIFKDPKSFTINRSAAAYYLAEMRAPEAVDALAADITLQFELNIPAHNLNGLEMKWSGYVAMQALVKIGNPSIPPVIRNLTESDDAKVRELSLQVLTRIDGDKDISQLRLQKALKAEKDSQKQARLHVALKSLANGQ
jgi:PBS lyase HEAT-like repeat